MDLSDLARDINAWALELGFEQVGITDTDVDAYAPQYREWLAQRFNGDMGYLERNVDKRLQPAQLVPRTLRIISARMNYLTPAKPDVLNDRGLGYISRYALGRDYHKTVRRRLVKLAARIEEQAGGQYRAFTDSAPVLEKPLAEKSGLGWIGKNTLLLNESAGSWFFLGEIFTDIPLPVSTHPAEHKCGACRACINVCPTDAIVGPGQLDARRCISYLTIENKGAIDEALRPAIGNRIFGCDDCQLICPWNRFAQLSSEPDFVPRHGLDGLSLIELLGWDEATFLERTEGMAIRRINYSQWVRNLAVAAGNAEPTPRLISALDDKLTESHTRNDAMCAEHLSWALGRLRQGS